MLIPQAVFSEVVTAGAGRPGVVEIPAMSWIELRPLAGRDVVEELASRLGRGEAEAIALARELRGTTRLLIDDRLGRGIANEMGLSIVGSAGVLVLAEEQGLIPAVRPILDELCSSGLYLGDATRRELLSTAGEPPDADV